MRLVRRIFGLPWLLPVTALLLRARAVRQSGRFIVRELRGRDQGHEYRLRTGGLKAIIRHGTPDVVTLGEVFHEWDYVPPAAVAHRLAAPARILDLGANVGLFGVFVLSRWPGAEVIAFEPDPDNVAMHRRTIAANGLAHRWRLIPAAAGVHNGEVRFRAGGGSLSRLVAHDDADSITVRMADVTSELSHADLVKMDIEGGEWAILGEERFRRNPPAVLVLEYHPHLCPRSDPRAAAEEALTSAGLEVASIRNREDGHGLLWAWRR